MSRPEYVYVVGVGERGEGIEVQRAFRSLADARGWAMLRYNVYPQMIGQGEWEATRANGVDQVRISRVRLEAADVGGELRERAEALLREARDR